jgi:hypothetical protein
LSRATDEARGTEIGVQECGTPAEVIDKINKEINAGSAIQDEGAVRRSGRRANADDAAEFGKLIADETDKWAKVIRMAASSRHDPADHRSAFSRLESFWSIIRLPSTHPEGARSALVAHDTSAGVGNARRGRPFRDASLRDVPG